MTLVNTYLDGIMSVWNSIYDRGIYFYRETAFNAVLYIDDAEIVTDSESKLQEGVYLLHKYKKYMTVSSAKTNTMTFISTAVVKTNIEINNESHTEEGSNFVSL